MSDGGTLLDMGQTPGTADVVRGYFQELWCEGRGDAVRRYYAPVAQLNGEPVDPDEFGTGVVSWFQKFPDFSATVEEVLTVDVDRVVSRVTYRGTHRGTWAGLPPTGRSFSTLGLDTFRIADGLIVEHWHATDHFEVIDQLGGKAVPREAT